jgi:hypothetical protein
VEYSNQPTTKFFAHLSNVPLSFPHLFPPHLFQAQQDKQYTHKGLLEDDDGHCLKLAALASLQMDLEMDFLMAISQRKEGKISTKEEEDSIPT